MSSFLCFICHSTVNAETNEEIREKYREVVGIHLCPDSQLCFICCHVLNKLSLFRSICLKRSLEYPVLFSEKGTLNLQKSDLEIHVLCPHECNQYQQRHNNKTYQFNHTDDSNEDASYDNDNQYVKLEDDEFHDYYNQSKYHNISQQYNYGDRKVNSGNLNADDEHLNTDVKNLRETNDRHNDECNNETDVPTESNLKNDNSNVYALSQEENGITEKIESDFTNNSGNMTDNNESLNKFNTSSNFHNIYDNCDDVNLNGKPEDTLDEENYDTNTCALESDIHEYSSPTNEITQQSKVKKIKKKDYKKIILSLDEQKADLEVNRKDKKYIEAEFKCYNCALSFLFKDTYQAHMMRHEESNGEYQCQTCTLRFATVALLRTHTASHAERYKCRKCACILKQRAKRQHSCYKIQESQSVSCHLCGNLFRNSNGLQQHLKRIHGSKTSGRLYTCTVCGESYTNQSSLRTHMIKHINRKFHCDKCPAIYKSPYTLEQHKKWHETGGTLHYCTVCGAGYATRKSLLAHTRNTSNHQTTLFECPICSRICPNQKSLASHIQSVHSTTKDYCCNLCPARYTNRKSLVRHIGGHTKKTDSKLAICHLCGSSYKSTSKLNRHLREVCEKAKLEEQLSALYN